MHELRGSLSQCAAVCCSVLQCAAGCCRVMHARTQRQSAEKHSAKCIYIYIYVCIRVCKCICVYVYMCIYVCVSVCV